MFVDLCVGFEVKSDFKNYVTYILNTKFSEISGHQLALVLELAKLMLEQTFFLNVGGACLDFIGLDSVDYANKLFTSSAAKTALAHIDGSYENILPLAMHSEQKAGLISNLLKSISTYHAPEDLYKAACPCNESDLMWQKSSHVLENTPNFLLDYFNNHLAILSLFHTNSIILIRIFSLLPYNTILQLVINFFICNGIIRKKKTYSENVSTYINAISNYFKASQFSSYIPTGQFRLELEHYLCTSKNVFCYKGSPSSFA